MWVIVIGPAEQGYTGFLDSDPGIDDLSLRERGLVVFRPEHVADIDRQPRDYIEAKYGPSLLED